MDGDSSASGRLEASHVYIGQLIEGVMDWGYIMIKWGVGWKGKSPAAQCRMLVKIQNAHANNIRW